MQKNGILFTSDNCPFYAFYKGKKVTSSSASTGSFNFLPSVSSGARTSLELGISGYSFSEEENQLYKGITVGEEIELHWVQQDMGKLANTKMFLLLPRK